MVTTARQRIKAFLQERENHLAFLNANATPENISAAIRVHEYVGGLWYALQEIDAGDREEDE